MELQATLDAVRALLRQGDTGAALETLRLSLEENKRQYTDALPLLHSLEANYGAIRQQELKGILSVQESQREYNRINDGLLSILADLSAGRKPVTVATSRRRMAWLIGGAAVFFLVALVFYVFRDNPSCPNYQSSDTLHVMLLPFLKVEGNAKRPEITLQERIRELTTNNKLPSEVEILVDYDSERKNPDIRGAAELGRHCSADFVVWGSYSDSDSTRVNVKYVFPNNEQKSGSTGFQAFRNLTELQSGAMLNRTLDDAILSLCAMMALRADNIPLAKKWLDKVKEPGAQDSAMIQIVNQTN